MEINTNILGNCESEIEECMASLQFNFKKIYQMPATCSELTQN